LKQYTASTLVLYVPEICGTGAAPLRSCFLKAWLSLDRFEGKAQFSIWLMGIVIDEALDSLNGPFRLVRDCVPDSTQLKAARGWSQ
jgi:hypothetical protein